MRSRFRALASWASFVALVAIAGSVRAQGEPAPTTGLPPPDEPLDLSTPRRALRYFDGAVADGEWIDAARVLDLRDVPPERAVPRGEGAARAIDAVLTDRGVTPESLPDEAEPGGSHVVGVAWIPGVEPGVVMRRLLRDGRPVWVFSRTTVRVAPDLAARIDRGPIGNRLGPALREPRFAELEPWQWIGSALALVIAAVLATATGRALVWLVWRSLRREERAKLGRAVKRVRPPARLALTLAYLGLLAILLRYPPSIVAVLADAYRAAWIVAVGWLVVRGIDFAAQAASERAAARQGWRARMVRTRVILLRRALNVVATVVFASVLLLQFPPVREVGVSLLASAGVAGVVVGIAAQRTLGNLLAGIQLSFTQPLRVGDQVVIENEFGTVEEVNLSYVVVRVWDQRCLIVPMARLLELPFQNWTRAADDLIGDVFFYVDFATPIERLRPEIERFVRAHPLWDRRVLGVQVVEATERAAKVRVLVSARDAGSTWDLRCATREFVLGLLQRLEGGRYLPRMRLDDVERPSEGSGARRLS
ncbi:mechanosensitive ion channel family protein [Sandaracinus amylolyticus]|uniref:MscS Mechanosensitive ion channel n=1 Tax=Sandaracinus amylolyticus TaxID=927083 RepID=A0A0F6SER5_9BACT|nr:mechanosensitive ion channel domain-containing protein [Sandaracinus amylolyticus]AKF05654.1 MscS Mechanosensitive ion channel [Sandaracinus amylolyticus]